MSRRIASPDQSLHIRPDLPRRELEHQPPPRRVQDDRAGDRVDLSDNPSLAEGPLKYILAELLNEVRRISSSSTRAAARSSRIRIVARRSKCASAAGLKIGLAPNQNINPALHPTIVPPHPRQFPGSLRVR